MLVKAVTVKKDSDLIMEYQTREVESEIEGI